MSLLIRRLWRNGTLGIGLCVIGIAIALVSSPWCVDSASAENIDVKASVPYDPPTQPAAIQPELDGIVAKDALVTISGSCQRLSLPTIVSIWRGGVSIGSASCDGSFSLQIMLAPGDNILVARTATVNGDYGPDSLAVTLKLMLLPPATAADPTVSPTVSSDEPATIQEKTRVTNEAARSGLTITTPQPFSVLSDGNKADITILISGGLPPYTIELNWGNGVVQSKAVEAQGAYTYPSAYSKPGTYIMHGRIRDKHGAYAEFSYAIVSLLKPIGAVTGTNSAASSAGFDLTGKLPVAVTSVVVTGLVGLATFTGFRLGETEVIKSLRRPPQAAKTSGGIKRNTNSIRRKK